jgi:tRNA threonylcarbamoyl adenosine modification protein YeaZ
MLTLLIETSTERGIVAISQDGELIYTKELPPGLQNSTYLMPAIDSGLKELSLAPKQLSLIAAGIGPGSYTGLRVGAAAAKAIAFALSLPIAGICTLAGFIPLEEGPFASLIDAKQGGVYVMMGEKKEGKIVYLSEPAVLQLPETLKLCQAAKWLVTPNAVSLKQKMSADLPVDTVWIERYPDPLQMLRMAEEMAHQGKTSTAANLDLLYLKEWRDK